MSKLAKYLNLVHIMSLSISIEDGEFFFKIRMLCALDRLLIRLIRFDFFNFH